MEKEEDLDMEFIEVSSLRRGKRREREQSTSPDREDGKRVKAGSSHEGQPKNFNVIMSAVGGVSISSVNPIKFGNALQKAIGNVKRVKQIKSRDLLITCTSQTQVKKLLNLTS